MAVETMTMMMTMMMMMMMAKEMVAMGRRRRRRRKRRLHPHGMPPDPWPVAAETRRGLAREPGEGLAGLSQGNENLQGLLPCLACLRLGPLPYGVAARLRSERAGELGQGRQEGWREAEAGCDRDARRPCNRWVLQSHSTGRTTPVNSAGCPPPPHPLVQPRRQRASARERLVVQGLQHHLHPDVAEGDPADHRPHLHGRPGRAEARGAPAPQDRKRAPAGSDLFSHRGLEVASSCPSKGRGRHHELHEEALRKTSRPGPAHQHGAHTRRHPVARDVARCSGGGVQVLVREAQRLRHAPGSGATASDDGKGPADDAGGGVPTAVWKGSHRGQRMVRAV
mmetsp:Transcript_15421/g.37930  ORF Transcript_15421/g.37930 Transcript_15421/m.37930 type:complete len:338 (-) Transcript_15421:2125-3138(-)